MSVFGKVFLALCFLLVTEFMVTAIIFIFFKSLFPNRKFKTIRKKINAIGAFKRFILINLFEFGKNAKTIFTFAVCWIYRIYSLFCAMDMVFVEQPTPYGRCLILIWSIMLIIPGVIWLKKFK